MLYLIYELKLLIIFSLFFGVALGSLSAYLRLLRRDTKTHD